MTSLSGVPGITASAPAAGVASNAAEVAYYAQVLSALPGTYSGNEKAYDGLTWPALYRKLAAQQPSADPKQLADTVLGIADTQGVATGAIKPVVDATSNTASSIAKGADAFTNQVPKVPNPLTGINAIGDFFSRLTDASTWIRIAKVVAGGVLLIVGLAHMSGADNAAFKAARNVPLPV